MAETIWKFELIARRDSNAFFAEMPKGAKPLSAGYQNGNFVAWAIVDPEAEKERHFFHVSGTGHELPVALRDGGRLLNRIEVSQPSGLLIFHAFDTGPWDTQNG